MHVSYENKLENKLSLLRLGEVKDIIYYPIRNIYLTIFSLDVYTLFQCLRFTTASKHVHLIILLGLFKCSINLGILTKPLLLAICKEKEGVLEMKTININHQQKDKMHLLLLTLSCKTLQAKIQAAFTNQKEQP